MTRRFGVLACLLLLPVVAGAATDAQIKAAFAEAQKKGAVSVYEDRCRADGRSEGSLYFPDTTAASIAKATAAMAAYAALQPHGSESAACTAGMQRGDSRIFELYPDGSVKAQGH